MAAQPTILLIPGLNNSGPNHWQTYWENDLPNAHRVELGSWGQPRRNSWITKLGIAISQTDAPTILVAHSLGCLATAWWVANEPDVARFSIAGALLVAPCNVDSHPVDPRLKQFGPAPRVKFPFPTIVVGSENDPYCTLDHTKKLARKWGARFVNAGRFGHINAESGIGDWPYGLYLLGDLLRQQNIDSFGHEAPLAPRTIQRRLPIVGETIYEEGSAIP